MKETKSERFVRVVESRVNKALDSIENVGDCADIRCYAYTPQQVETIFSALEKAVADAKQRFTNGSGRKTVFRLGTPDHTSDVTVPPAEGSEEAE
ncbi:MAG: hypothetical protein IJH11_08340 [Lachnospiraceae bacterium]|nr:hypothetical protein [Lachnospiraceae bacterium]